MERERDWEGDREVGRAESGREMNMEGARKERDKEHVGVRQ